MIQAAPFILPIAEALGLSVATLGMAKVTDEVNKYIQENPEQAQKLITTLMPAQGIASMFEGKDDDNLPKKIDEEKTPQEEPPEDTDLLPEKTKQTAEEVIRKEIKELEDKAEHKFQYMANKEGGQTIGNKEIIVKLDKEIFNKYVKKLSNIKTFEKHEKEFPNTYVKFFKREDLPEYKITKVGQLGEEIDTEENIYNIKVKNFNSKKAIKHSKTFDSDVYPIEKAMGGIIDKPLTGNSRYI